MLKQYPAIDKENKFLFFRNPKVAQKSIAWKTIRNRVIVPDRKKYEYRLFRKWARQITLEKMNLMFKFTFIRNPWDRTVSAFFYLKDKWQKHPRKPTIIHYNNFSKFITRQFVVGGVNINPHFAHQYLNVIHSGKQFVDFIGRFENLEKDWVYVASVINANPILPHVNATPHKHYAEYYDEESKQIVAEIYKKDIELFNYTFDGENK